MMHTKLHVPNKDPGLLSPRSWWQNSSQGIQSPPPLRTWRSAVQAALCRNNLLMVSNNIFSQVCCQSQSLTICTDYCGVTDAYIPNIVFNVRSAWAAQWQSVGGKVCQGTELDHEELLFYARLGRTTRRAEERTPQRSSSESTGPIDVTEPESMITTRSAKLRISSTEWLT